MEKSQINPKKSLPVILSGCYLNECSVDAINCMCLTSVEAETKDREKGQRHI